MSVWMNVALLEKTRFHQDASDAFFLSASKILERLKEKKVPVSVRAVVMTDSPPRLIVFGGLRRAHLRYVAEYGILGDGLSIQELENGRVRILSDGNPELEIAFPKEGVAAILPVGADEGDPACEGPEWSFDVRSAFSVPEDKFAFALTLDDPGRKPALALMSGIRRLSVVASYDPALPRPVSGRVLLEAADDASALRLYAACADYFKEVYANAAKLGPIPADLADAFRTSMRGRDVVVDVSLKEEHAAFLLKTWRSKLSEALTPALAEELESLQ